MNESPEYITFFHYSPFYSEKFYKGRASEVLEREYNRPTFFWFSDRYASHNLNYRLPYLYFFVKNPVRDNILLRSRHDDIGFHGLYEHFLYYKNHLVSGEYNEPSILMSFSIVQPDLILEFKDSDADICYVVKPDTAKGTPIHLFDEQRQPRIFSEIPELVNLLPELPNSLPFVEPKKDVSGRYTYKNWQPMITEKMGTWL